MQKPTLVQIKTEDGLTLPGLFYKRTGSKKAGIFLHGNGSVTVFYSDDMREEQAKALDKLGISYLLFNNRGAHYIKKLDIEKKGRLTDKKLYGTAYEKIKDCIKDIDGAINFLEKEGFKEFYLIGESTGANKICVYNYYKPNNKVSKYILIGGGDDTGIYYNELGKERFFKLLKEAKEKIKMKKGEELIANLLPDNIIVSYIAYFDTCNPDGDYNVFPFLEVLKNIKLSKKPLFRHFKSLNKPTLVIYGEKDEYAWGDVPKIIEILKQQKPELDYFIIKNADHSLSNHQKELGKLLINWLKKMKEKKVKGETTHS